MNNTAWCIMEYKSGFNYNFNRFSQIAQIPGLVENLSSVGEISLVFWCMCSEYATKWLTEIQFGLDHMICWPCVLGSRHYWSVRRKRNLFLSKWTIKPSKTIKGPQGPQIRRPTNWICVFYKMTYLEGDHMTLPFCLSLRVFLFIIWAWRTSHFLPGPLSSKLWCDWGCLRLWDDLLYLSLSLALSVFAHWLIHGLGARTEC